jgi:hypothetical protein
MACSTEIQARIDAIRNTELPEVRTAISTLIKGGHSQYVLDSGQSNQMVKRLSLKELNDYKKELEAELQRLVNSCGSSGQIGGAFF